MLLPTPNPSPKGEGKWLFKLRLDDEGAPRGAMHPKEDGECLARKALLGCGEGFAPSPTGQAEARCSWAQSRRQKSFPSPGLSLRGVGRSPTYKKRPLPARGEGVRGRGQPSQ